MEPRSSSGAVDSEARRHLAASLKVAYCCETIDVELAAGRPARLVFSRQTESPCPPRSGSRISAQAEPFGRPEGDW